MKNKVLQSIGSSLLLLLLFAGCSNDPYDEWFNNSPIFPDAGNGNTDDSGSNTLTGTLFDFEINIDEADTTGDDGSDKIGRASCRESVYVLV